MELAAKKRREKKKKERAHVDGEERESSSNTGNGNKKDANKSDERKARSKAKAAAGGEVTSTEEIENEARPRAKPPKPTSKQPESQKTGAGSKAKGPYEYEEYVNSTGGGQTVRSAFQQGRVAQPQQQSSSELPRAKPDQGQLMNSNDPWNGADGGPSQRANNQFPGPAPSMSRNRQRAPSLSGEIDDGEEQPTASVASNKHKKSSKPDIQRKAQVPKGKADHPRLPTDSEDEKNDEDEDEVTEKKKNKKGLPDATTANADANVAKGQKHGDGALAKEGLLKRKTKDKDDDPLAKAGAAEEIARAAEAKNAENERNKEEANAKAKKEAEEQKKAEDAEDDGATELASPYQRGNKIQEPSSEGPDLPFEEIGSLGERKPEQRKGLPGAAKQDVPVPIETVPVTKDLQTTPASQDSQPPFVPVEEVILAKTCSPHLCL